MSSRTGAKPTPDLPTLDDLHPADGEGPWFTETAWYSCWTPGGEWAVHIYLRFRANLGLANASVYAWREGTATPWEAGYWKDVDVTIPSSLVDMNLLGGLRHVEHRPFEHYEIGYTDDSGYGPPFAFELRLESAAPPDYFGRKHFDQRMRVTGRLYIDDNEYNIDCFAMRDRSWYRRSDFALFRSAYSYVLHTSELAFLALQAAPRGVDLLVDEIPVVGGYVLRDGRIAALVGGTRSVTRRDPRTGNPVELVVTATDSSGSRFEAHGRVANALGIACNTSMLSWMSLVTWSFAGREGLGEDQEIWSPSLWRAFRDRRFSLSSTPVGRGEGSE